MKKKHIYLGFVLVWMLIIFYFSSQQATQSQDLSNGFMQYIEEIFHIHRIDTNTPLGEFISFFIRKVAHLSEYAILGMFLYLYFHHASNKHAFLWALCIAVFYAGSDEFHQIFVEGRSGQFLDVGIDTIGVLLGLSVQQVWLFGYRKHKDKV